MYVTRIVKLRWLFYILISGSSEVVLIISQHKQNWHFAVLKLGRLKLRMQGFQAETIFLVYSIFRLPVFNISVPLESHWIPEVTRFLESTWKNTFFKRPRMTLILIWKIISTKFMSITTKSEKSSFGSQTIFIKTILLK